MFDLIALKRELSSLNLLLVDDDPGARKHMRSFFSHLFGHVYEAQEGQEALEIYQNNEIDLIITDILMPKMTGFELIDEIRKLNRTQKIIVMSAQSDKEMIVKAITYSVDGYILKPINEDQIFAAIQKAVYERAIELENQNYQNELEHKVEAQVARIEAYSKKVIRQLEYDHLTGLPNKEKLQLDYEQNSFHWFLLINIDNLEYINLAYGVEEGDLLIACVAGFLTEMAGESVYRVNGDEFFIVSQLERKEAVEALAERIHKKVYDKRFKLSKASVRITFTIAIVNAFGESRVPYRKAHLAIKQIRQKHKNSIGFYEDDPFMKSYHEAMNEWAYKSKLALELDLLIPYYQPIINIQSGKIEKYECLARIMEQDSVIAPVTFIEPTKIAGMIVDITKRMIIKSFERFKDSDMEFSINITDDDLKEEYLIDYLNEQAQTFGIRPAQVVLEVLENISEYDATHALIQLETLKSLGYQIAIDDFGAQSSNFARLQKLRIDYIKIDGGFIKHIHEDMNSLNIVKTIVYYAKLSGHKTIAEYVHNQEVYETVRTLGIDYAQGYYFYPPLKDLL